MVATRLGIGQYGAGGSQASGGRSINGYGINAIRTQPGRVRALGFGGSGVHLPLPGKPVDDAGLAGRDLQDRCRFSDGF